MEAREPISLNAKNADGVGLQVRFSWRQDRHCHTISLLVDDRPIPYSNRSKVQVSTFGLPAHPLQQRSVEELRPATKVALLVGMAGKSHWSMSVEPANDRAGFVFDVACRSGETAGQLGSGYLLLADGLRTDGDHDATIDVAGRSSDSL